MTTFIVPVALHIDVQDVVCFKAQVDFFSSKLIAMGNTGWLTALQQAINKSLNITDAQSAPILITISVFVVGGLLRTLSGFFRNYSIRSANRTQFYLLVDHLIASAAMQGEGYLNTSDTLNLMADQPFYFRTVDFFHASILKDISFTKSYEAFFLGFENRFIFRVIHRKQKIEHFHTCWNLITSLPDWQKAAETRIKYVEEHYNELNDSRYKQLLDIDQVLYRWYSSIWGDPNADPARNFYKGLIEISRKWGEMENNASPEVSQKYLVEPMLKVCVGMQFLGAHEIGFTLRNISAIYANLSKMMKIHKEQFASQAASFEEAATELYKAKQGLRNRAVHGGKGSS